jgi:uncharacterized protein YukE
VATDAALLLRGLQDYRTTLDLHLQKLQQEWDQLDRMYAAFRSVYEGDAAREFHTYWLRTRLGFEQYIDGTRRISQVLDERITALIEAERTGLLGS